MKLHAMFTDHMVLPANKPLRVWGDSNTAVIVTLAGHTATAAPQDGRFTAHLPAMPYGGPYTLTVTDGNDTVILEDVYIGEVYMFSGQSNMQHHMLGSYDTMERWPGNSRLRFFTANRPQDDELYVANDGWMICTDETVRGRSAIAFLAAHKLLEHKDESIAIGIVSCYQGASIIESWMSEETLKKLDIHIPNEQKHVDHVSNLFSAWNSESFLYHFMLEQVIGYPLSGIVWYQGESDTSPAEGRIYDIELKALIDQWRAEFCDPALPIVIVQLADFDFCEDLEGWKEVQAAQERVAATVPHTALVKIRDVSERDDIHPRTKEQAGFRVGEALLKIC